MNEHGQTAPAAPPRRKTSSQSDFLSGAGLGLLGVLVLVDAIRMPFYEEGTRGLLSAPGLTPGLLALTLILLSGLLMYRARGFKPNLQRFKLQPETLRVFALIGILLGYVALIKPLGYVTATFLMMAVFQASFMKRRTVATIALWAVGLSAVVTGALYYVFAKLFLIPMP